MVEREVKLEIPADRVAALAADLQREPCQSVALRAIYFDTPDQALARNRVALRLRREGKQWFQTVKAAGPSGLERLEDTVVIKAVKGRAAPAPDLGRHTQAKAKAALRRALGLSPRQPWPPLVAAFEVKVERLLREVRHGESVLELALDRGSIEANGRRHELNELELELKEGRFEDALQLARQWREAHGLWLSVISKAAKGRRLADGEPHGPAVGAQPVELPRGSDIDQLARVALLSCLDQVLANASEVAAGCTAPEHVHQLRIGLRRLRTVLRTLPLPGVAPQALDAPLVQVFRALGAHRDVTHVLQAVQPQVESAGGPVLPIAAEASAAPEIGEVVRSAAFQDALLALLAVAARQDGEGGRARKAVRPILERLWRQVVRDGRRFTELDVEAQHRVRKRLKRLRYLAEFVAPVFRPRPVARFLADVKPVQDALGLYNDEGVALQAYRARSATEPEALFGVGWLQARRPVEALACRKLLRRLARTEPFWR